MSNTPDDRPIPPPPYGVAPPPPPPPAPPPAGPFGSAHAAGQLPSPPPPPYAPAAPAAPGHGQPTPPAYGQPQTYGYQPVVTKPPRPPVPIAAALLLVGGALVILGCLLNWFSVLGTDFNGFSSDGDGNVKDGPFFTFLAAVLIGFAITFFAARRVFVIAILAVIFASVVVIAGLGDFGDVTTSVDDVRDVFDDAASVGPGLPVVVLGGLVCLAGGIVALAKRRR